MAQYQDAHLQRIDSIDPIHAVQFSVKRIGHYQIVSSNINVHLQNLSLERCPLDTRRMIDGLDVFGVVHCLNNMHYNMATVRPYAGDRMDPFDGCFLMISYENVDKSHPMHSLNATIETI
jgi:hypothetical protein